MTQEWRANLHMLTPLRKVRRTFADEHLIGATWRIEDIWPDIRKTIIYSALLEHGVDAAKFRLQERYVGGAAMATFISFGYEYDKIPIDGVLGVDASILKRTYPDENSYIVLVHELAHVYQTLEGELRNPNEVRWIDAHHERDAIRWSARQAKKMGWSKAKTDEVLRKRYSEHRKGKDLETIALQGRIGYSLHPEQTTIPFLQRRGPVRVRAHRRRA